jgi:glycosyltransferase involved in cell wall biosynthesis
LAKNIKTCGLLVVIMLKSTFKPTPLRVLHILNSLGFGGAESWLRHLLHCSDQSKYLIDIMVHEERPGYAEEIKNYGGEIILCPYSINPLRYGKNFKNLLRLHGPFDIVHSHLGMGGFHAWWAHQAGVPVRVVHNHTDDRELIKSSIIKKIGIKASQYLISQYATAGIAVSQAAANRFGKSWGTDSRWRILYCGIDLVPFKKSDNLIKVRQKLGIPTDYLVVGHVGRFTQEKNHTFLLDIFLKLLDFEPNSLLLLVGDGLLRPDIEVRAKNLGIEGKVMFTGIRQDVEELMLGAMDVFLLPSLYEGLPLVLLEAQAAGLPCIISNIITEEAAVVCPLMKRLSLTQNPAIWARKIIDCRNVKRNPETDNHLKLMEDSEFNIRNSSLKLFNLYNELITAGT